MAPIPPTANQNLIPVKALGTDLSYWAGMAAIVLAIIFFYSGLSMWIIVRGVASVTPGKLIIVVIFLSLAAATASLIAGRRPPFIIILVPAIYMVLVFASGIVHQQDYQQTIARLGFMMTLPALIISAQATSRSATRRAMIVGLIFICLANLIDYFFSSFLPIPMSEIKGRAGGFHINPNISAMLIALTLPMAIPSITKKYRPFLYAITGAAVLVTLSRGGMMLWITAAVLTESFMVRKVALTGGVVVAIILALFAFSGIIVFGDDIVRGVINVLGPYLSPETVSRLYFDTNDFAAEDRRFAALYAWDLFIQYPIFGSGVAGGTRWAFGVLSHNMILQTLAEFGLVGLLWLLGFFAMLRKVAVSAAVVLICLWLLASVFSHNLFDDPAVAVLIAFYGSQCWRRDDEPASLVRRSASPLMRRVAMPIRNGIR